jgi:hypothetical protein
VADLEHAGIVWRKSTASGGGNCVEVAFAETSVFVRQSRDPLGPILSFSREAWAQFLASAKSGN